MNLFYNVDGVGDVLLIQLSSSRPQSVITKSYGDVTLIHEEATGELIAINLFHGSTICESRCCRWS